MCPGAIYRVTREDVSGASPEVYASDRCPARIGSGSDAETYRGNVRWTFPHRYVGMWQGRYGLYCQPGNGKARRAVARRRGRRLSEALGDRRPPFDWVWR